MKMTDMQTQPRDGQKMYFVIIGPPRGYRGKGIVCFFPISILSRTVL